MTPLVVFFVVLVNFGTCSPPPIWHFIVTAFQNRTLASGVLRGKMLAPFVQTALRRTSSGSSGEVRVVVSDQFEIESSRVDVCVCVKCNGVMVDRLVDRCHQRGGRFVWEVLDLAGVISYVDYLKSTVDLWLVSNRPAAALFLWRGAKRAAVAHHHHTNLLARTTDCRRNAPVRVVASTYAATNQPLEFERRLAARLAEHRIDYRPVLSKFFLDTENPSADNGWLQSGFHEGLDDVDVAVIFPPAIDLTHTMLRPVTRLAFWWSHGIPVIYYPTATYVEATHGAGVGTQFACDNVDCVVDRIVELSGDPARRCAYAAAALDASRRFAVQASADQFVDTVLRELAAPRPRTSSSPPS
jgi:hypothetical protein